MLKKPGCRCAAQPALVHGRMNLEPITEQVLAFERADEQQRILCVFNFSDTTALWPLPQGWTNARALDGSGLTGARVADATVHCEPWGGLYLQAV